MFIWYMLVELYLALSGKDIMFFPLICWKRNIPTVYSNSKIRNTLAVITQVIHCPYSAQLKTPNKYVPVLTGRELSGYPTAPVIKLLNLVTAVASPKFLVQIAFYLN